MAVEVLRTRSYDDDLAKIWSCWRERSAIVADQIVRRIESRVELLSEFPAMGEAQPQHGSCCRRILAAKNYVVYYDQWEDRVEILRVFHAARNRRELTDD